MADNLDNMLQDDNPGASSAQDGQQTDSSQAQPIEQQTAEEVEFNKLSGSSQERIKELWARARAAEEALESERNARPAYVPPAPGVIAPDQKAAIETLSNYGIATDSKVDQKLSQATNQILWNMEQQRLEEKYEGENGEPQYVREEVEDYIRKHPQYQGYAAEDVFKYKMFPDEFSNLKTETKPKRSSTLRPTKAQVLDETLTPDYIEQRLKQPDGQQWYNDHLDEINRVTFNHTQQFKGQGI